MIPILITCRSPEIFPLAFSCLVERNRARNKCRRHFNQVHPVQQAIRGAGSRRSPEKTIPSDNPQKMTQRQKTASVDDRQDYCRLPGELSLSRSKFNTRGSASFLRCAKNRHRSDCVGCLFCVQFEEIGVGVGCSECYRCDVAVNLMAGGICRWGGWCGREKGRSSRAFGCLGAWKASERKQGERHVGSVEKNQRANFDW